MTYQYALIQVIGDEWVIVMGLPTLGWKVLTVPGTFHEALTRLGRSRLT